jgi:hypothetical protein
LRSDFKSAKLPNKGGVFHGERRREKMATARRGSSKRARQGSSKGDFVDYLEKASHDAQVRDDFLNEAYKPGETPEKLLVFFGKKKYYGVSYEDCQKIITIAQQGPLPCAFNINQY